MIRKLLLMLLLPGLCLAQATASNPLYEPFDSLAATAQWSIQSGDGNSVRWYVPGELRGMHLQNTSAGLAYAPWLVGSTSFALEFSANISNCWLKGNNQKLGFVIALTTAIPGSMSPGDTSIAIAFTNPGIYTGMRSGELTALAGADVSGGLLGYNESVDWPQGSSQASIPTNWNWRFTIGRDNSNNLTWSVFVDQFQGGNTPWFTKTFAIPAAYQTKSFQYFVMQTLNSSNSAPFLVTGQISNIKGVSSVTGGPVHTVTGISPSGDATTFHGGSTAIITGANFDNSSGYQVKFSSIQTAGTQPKIPVRDTLAAGLSPAIVTATYINSTTLKVTLPDVASTPLPYRLQVIRNGIVAELNGGIHYSRPIVFNISPQEVPPFPANSADATVAINGAGFTSATTVTIGGNAASVTLISPTQLSVIVPSGTMGMPSVLVKTGPAVIYDSTNPGTYPPSGKINFGYAPHPYLHFNANGLNALRTKYANPAFANYVEPLNRNIGTPPPPDGYCAPGTCWPPGQVQTLWDYFWHYLFAQDSASYTNFENLISAELARIDWTTQYGASFNLGNAEQIAVIYDALFPQLTPAQRATYLNYLDKALAYFRYVRVTKDFNTVPAGATFDNRIAVANGGGGVVALALINSISSVQGFTTTAPWVSTTGAAESTAAVANLESGPFSYGNNEWMADGGGVEGTQYDHFGGMAYLRFAHALVNTNNLLNITPADLGLFETNVQYFQNYVNTVWDGYDWQTYNDTQPQYYLVPILADFGDRYSQPQLLYMADYLENLIANQDSGFVNHLNQQVSGWSYAPYAFMWRSTNPGAFTAFPTTSVLPLTEYATLRSSSAFSADFVVGIKGSGPNEIGTNQHAHPDQGSFVIQSRGEEFLIDPGYYVSAALNHSLNQVDGVVPVNQAGRTASFDKTVQLDTGIFRSVAVDATNAYPSGISRLRRTFTMYANGSNRFLVVLDDVQPQGPGSVVSYYQAGQLASVNGSAGFTLTGAGSQLIAMVDGPARVISSGPGNLNCSTPTPSWVFCELATHYVTIRASYTALAGTPLLTMFAPANSDGTGAMTAAVDRSTAGVINVNLSDGAKMQFNLQSGIWKLGNTTNPPGAVP